MVVFDLGENFLFKSVLGHCVAGAHKAVTLTLRVQLLGMSFYGCIVCVEGTARLDSQDNQNHSNLTWPKIAYLSKRDCSGLA